MNRFSLFAISLVASLSLALGGGVVAQAKWSDNLRVSENNDTVQVESGQTHKGSLYAAGKKVVVDGTVDGDLYCATNHVVINGTVNGDVLCAAQTVIVDGKVGHDVRLTAQSVTINGEVGGSLSALSQDIRIAGQAKVGGDFNGASQMMTLDGQVAGDFVATGQILRLNGQVAGDVDANYVSIDLAQAARVGGDFNYATADRQQLNAGDQVAGTVNYNPPADHPESNGKMLAGALVVVFAAMLLTALIVALVMPRFVHRSSQLLRQQGPLTVLAGFAFVFGAPIVAVMIGVTVFLLPIAVLLMLAYLTVVMLSGIFFAYYIGSVLLRSVDNIVLRMLGGAVVLLILYMIPFVQILAMFAALVVGSGMIVTTLTNGYRRPEYSLIPSAQPVASKAKTTRTGSKSKSKKN